MILKSDITGLVLAGGRATRMGGVDKGLQRFCGLPLARHAAQRLRAQTGALAINANRHLDEYRAFGFPVWPDAASQGSPRIDAHGSGDPRTEVSRGPLEGIRTGLEQCRTLWLVTVPCDSPWFPLDLVEHLAHAAHAVGADAAMAALSAQHGANESPGRGLFTQPVFSLLSVNLLESLTRYLDGGGRKAGGWMRAQNCTVVVFDEPEAFANANTFAELHALESVRASVEN